MCKYIVLLISHRVNTPLPIQDRKAGTTLPIIRVYNVMAAYLKQKYLNVAQMLDFHCSTVLVRVFMPLPAIPQ